MTRDLALEPFVNEKALNVSNVLILIFNIETNLISFE